MLATPAQDSGEASSSSPESIDDARNASEEDVNLGCSAILSDVRILRCQATMQGIDQNLVIVHPIIAHQHATQKSFWFLKNDRNNSKNWQCKNYSWIGRL